MLNSGYKHFAVVDTPTVVDDFICRDPVVGLSSKYPFEEIHAVTADKDFANGIGLADSFTFSRKPLRVTLVLPEIGHCDVYVVHLKSKRADLDSLPPSMLEKHEQTYGDHLSRNVLGRWSASIQRGSEAVLLYHQIMKRRIETNNAIILMGDFNDLLTDGVLSSLTMNELRFEKEGKGDLASYPLTDAYELYLKALHSQLLSPPSTEMSSVPQKEGITEKLERPATHYYGNKGSVLDYILLSADFNPSFQGSVAEVIDYQTEDRHLINPSFERDGQSTDHAPVSCTITPRR